MRRPAPKILLGGVLLLLCLGIAVLRPHTVTPDQFIPVKIPAAVHKVVTNPAVGMPVRLAITNAGVDATIKPVGLTSEGDMYIDSDITTVAWYKLGPKPGEVGSAVIAGHYGWENGAAAVFNDLHTLHVGDIITTYDVSNVATNFVVQLIRNYDPDEDATAVFTSNDGKAHLNLITCEGTWESSLKTFSQRLVVFTDKET